MDILVYDILIMNFDRIYDIIYDIVYDIIVNNEFRQNNVKFIPGLHSWLFVTYFFGMPVGLGFFRDAVTNRFDG